jgi:hypothetical protein
MFANLLCAIAAEALISAFTIAPEAIDVTPALEIVMSPDIATEAALLVAFPTRIFPLVSGASLENAMFASAATFALVTDPSVGTETPASEIVKI